MNYRRKISFIEGTLSLLKNTVYGAFNTASKLTSAMSKGVTQLSLDDRYIADRAKRSRYKPKHAGDGLVEGTKVSMIVRLVVCVFAFAII